MADQHKCQCYVTFEADAKPVVDRRSCRLHPEEHGPGRCTPIDTELVPFDLCADVTLVEVDFQSPPEDALGRTLELRYALGVAQGRYPGGNPSTSEDPTDDARPDVAGEVPAPSVRATPPATERGADDSDGSRP